MAWSPSSANTVRSSDSRWIAASARIVSSRSEARKITKQIGSGRDVGKATEIRNFAVIRYAFEVDGRRIEGERIGIGEDLGNFSGCRKTATLSGGYARDRLF